LRDQDHLGVRDVGVNDVLSVGLLRSHAASLETSTAI
jgi:hypothetical protein